MRALPMIAALIGTVLIFGGPCRAQMPENADVSSQGELVLGTKEAPPFAMKAADGTWQGISIDLWRQGHEPTFTSAALVAAATR